MTICGVEMKFLPPPNVGHILVRKSYRCAATRPVSCASAALGPSMMKDMKSSAKGRYFESKVTMKKETWRVGLSCAKVYA